MDNGWKYCVDITQRLVMLRINLDRNYPLYDINMRQNDLVLTS